MTVVFKLGGSLMCMADFTDKVRAAVAYRFGQKCLIVPGGGASADVVREWSRIHLLSEETAHWLAVSSLDLNRQLLQTLLGWNCTDSRTDAEASWASRLSPLVLQMREFLQAEEAISSESIPHNWSVSSDSLAAWTALRWPADELVLIKSIPVPRGMTTVEASQQGLVDEYFPYLAQRLSKIFWCNLRASNVIVEPWLADSAES